ncbi:MAG: pirin family protein [Bacteroidota bacterium]|nr:pirin family protein [Candidatus Kapabacteria bacterium]MDW8271621.1 pirin family protein [Bacteroidota bacterium]
MIRFTAPLRNEGDGAQVRRPFPSPYFHWPLSDPFLFLDEFFVDPNAGFPDHPHRGFEIITYLLDGGFHHRDSLGNDIQAKEGTAMHFVTGSGVVHSEMPLGYAHGLQLWINLPRALKKIPPSLHVFSPEQLPVIPIAGGTIRRIASPDGPIQLHTEVHYDDVTFADSGTHQWTIPHDSVGMAYVLAGEFTINGQLTRAGELCAVEEGSLVLQTSQPGRAVVLCGKRQHESVKFIGPFVD